MMNKYINLIAKNVYIGKLQDELRNLQAAKEKWFSVNLACLY